MTALYYGKIQPQSAAATTAQAGFPASNVLLESIARCWKAAANGAETIDITLPAAQQVYAIELHDVNFAVTGTIQKSSNAIAFNNVAALTSYAGRHGRRRGLLIINDPSVLVIRIPIAAGASTDGLAWRIGSAGVYSSKFALPVAPVYPLPVRTARPRISTTLPNGVASTASTGLNFDRIPLTFNAKDTEALDTFIQKTTAGTCVLDTEYSPYPAQIWPVRMLDQDFEETHTGKRFSTMQAVVTEIISSP